MSKRSITELTADDIVEDFRCTPYKSAVWVTKENSPDRLPFEDEYRYTFNKPRNIKDTQEVNKISNVLEVNRTVEHYNTFYELNVLDRCKYVLKDESILICNGSIPIRWVLIRKEQIHG